MSPNIVGTTFGSIVVFIPVSPSTSPALPLTHAEVLSEEERHVFWLTLSPGIWGPFGYECKGQSNHYVPGQRGTQEGGGA